MKPDRLLLTRAYPEQHSIGSRFSISTRSEHDQLSLPENDPFLIHEKTAVSEVQVFKEVIVQLCDEEDDDDDDVDTTTKDVPISRLGDGQC